MYFVKRWFIQLICCLCEQKVPNSRLQNESYERPQHSFIHSGLFYSAHSSPLPLRGAPDHSTDTVLEFHAEAHRQLQVKDLPKVPTCCPERESNPRPFG